MASVRSRLCFPLYAIGRTSNLTDTILHSPTEMLTALERSLDNYTQVTPGLPQRLADAMRYSLLGGGKRLRPLMVLHATTACGSSWGDAMPAACAVEMVHVYSLIHDDLPAMDDDEMRRGRPSCHVEFDEGTAILAGDALLTRGFEILATSFDEDVARTCCRELAVAAGPNQLVGGQCDDLYPPPDVDPLFLLEEINRRKTAALLTVSLRLGAIIARADEAQVGHLTSFGQKLGLAFQIVDDLLDCEGNEGKIGKRTGQDQRQGKRTFPAVLGIESSRDRVQQLIQDAIGELECFGNTAQPLIDLAKFIESRDH